MTDRSVDWLCLGSLMLHSGRLDVVDPAVPEQRTVYHVDADTPAYLHIGYQEWLGERVGRVIVSAGWSDPASMIPPHYWGEEQKIRCGSGVLVLGDAGRIDALVLTDPGRLADRANTAVSSNEQVGMLESGLAAVAAGMGDACDFFVQRYTDTEKRWAMLLRFLNF